MATTGTAALRHYRADARSTDVFGRILCSAREHYFVSDGPPWNACPGEATNPGEFFLAAVAACAVELVQVIARDQQVTIGAVDARIEGVVDPEHPVRSDLTLFNSVRLEITVAGTSQATAEDLVQRFRRRCPLFGTVAAATAGLAVIVRAR